MKTITRVCDTDYKVQLATFLFGAIFLPTVAYLSGRNSCTSLEAGVNYSAILANIHQFCGIASPWGDNPLHCPADYPPESVFCDIGFRQGVDLVQNYEQHTYDQKYFNNTYDTCNIDFGPTNESLASCNAYLVAICWIGVRDGFFSVALYQNASSSLPEVNCDSAPNSSASSVAVLFFAMAAISAIANIFINRKSSSISNNRSRLLVKNDGSESNSYGTNQIIEQDPYKP